MDKISTKIRLQIKSLSKRQFEGHGSIFGNLDHGGDIVLPGAFKTTLAEHKSNNTLPLMLWAHDPSSVPGKYLDMDEDRQGLYVKGELADTELGNEIHTLLKIEAVRGMSIGYRTRDAEYNNDGMRLLKDLELFEVSIVSMAMNPKATVSMVKCRLSARGEYVPPADEIIALKRECEQFLESKGWGRRAAMAGVAAFFKGLTDETFDDPLSDTEVISDPTPIKSPDEMELDAGLSNFQSLLLVRDMDKILRRIL